MALRNFMFRCFGGSGLAFVVSTSMVLADPLFEATVEVGSTTGSIAFDTFEDLFDALTDSVELSVINPAYTDTSVAEVIGDLRGLEVLVTYPSSGPVVELIIEDIGVEEVFDMFETREANEDALLDFIEANENGILTAIYRELVAETPTDPVAGNPASLQGQMIGADFAAGTGFGEFGSPGPGSAGAPREGGRNALLGFGARFGQFSAGNFQQNVVQLPLSLTIPLEDPRWGIILDAPITYVETEGTDSLAISVGIGARLPVYDYWTLTPSLRVGAVGSVDLGSVAVIYSASLTSSFRWTGGGLNWELGNMIGYSATGPTISDSDFSIDYDLENTVFRNGISVSRPTRGRIFGSGTTWEASIVNTLIEGDSVFVDNYTDIAFSYGTQASRNGITWDSFRFGLTYTFSDSDYEGWRINFGYQF